MTTQAGARTDEGEMPEEQSLGRAGRDPAERREAAVNRFASGATPERDAR